MEQDTPDAFAWQDWDWRPLARLVVWVLLAAVWARLRHAVSLDLLHLVLRELVLGWLLSFGWLTYVQALIATSAFRLALALDHAAYALSERLVRPFAGRAPFAANFAAAFGVELGLVFGSVQFWRAAHMGDRAAGLLSEILR
ncbi:MAG: hypothetical protein M0D55_06645 [Elusimicrobiota bacterium]|nr:MAG: hypothetical protein M0D55_06645 [Elusimicrobiota bacterium]